MSMSEQQRRKRRRGGGDGMGEIPADRKRARSNPPNRIRCVAFCSRFLQWGLLVEVEGYERPPRGNVATWCVLCFDVLLE